MLDLRGAAASAAERELLAAPGVGGVVLFSRNFESHRQLRELVAGIHAVREPRLLVAVDHEGGRVQRFRDGFTPLPAAGAYGAAFDDDARRGVALAESGGRVMAAELRAIGIDLSFAPVLDIGSGRSDVIGDRAFHRDPGAVTRLARAFVAGMRSAGMAAVGKHFPGHGSVEGDSHHTLPVDSRDLETIRLTDLVPFERLARDGLPAVMPAHVLFPAVDDRPAGFSKRWISEVLRGELGFRGAVFSDDLSMAGAQAGGDEVERARAALAAGCDMVLVCNAPEAAARVAAALAELRDPVRMARVARLHGRASRDDDAARWAATLEADRAALRALAPEPELDLGDDTLL